jgi:alkyl hydroperoxide reductase subunit D
MTLQTLKDRLPEHAKDLKLNLGVLANPGELTPRLTWGTALATAIATRNADVIRAIAAEAAPHLDEATQRAARAAASVMAMNNVYYRAMHFLADHGDYQKMPARLRMQVIGNPGVDKLDFELWCLAVSAIHGCEVCVRSHERVVREKGASPGMVQDAIRIAAVVHALAVTLDGDAAGVPEVGRAVPEPDTAPLRVS